MALAIDIKHGLGQSNEMHRYLQPRKTKVTVFAINIEAKGILRPVNY